MPESKIITVTTIENFKLEYKRVSETYNNHELFFDFYDYGSRSAKNITNDNISEIAAILTNKTASPSDNSTLSFSPQSLENYDWLIKSFKKHTTGYSTVCLDFSNVEDTSCISEIPDIIKAFSNIQPSSVKLILKISGYTFEKDTKEKIIKNIMNQSAHECLVEINGCNFDDNDASLIAARMRKNKYLQRFTLNINSKMSETGASEILETHKNPFVKDKNIFVSVTGSAIDDSFQDKFEEVNKLKRSNSFSMRMFKRVETREKNSEKLPCLIM